MIKDPELITNFFVTQDYYNDNFKFFDNLISKKIKVTHETHGSRIGYFSGIAWKAEPIPVIPSILPNNYNILGDGYLSLNYLQSYYDSQYKKPASLYEAIKSKAYYVDIFYYLRDISLCKDYQLSCDYRDKIHISILQDNPNDFGSKYNER